MATELLGGATVVAGHGRAILTQSRGELRSTCTFLFQYRRHMPWLGRQYMPVQLKSARYYSTELPGLVAKSP